MKRIVIVEDHPVLISIYRNKFVAEGFQVEIAADGEKGLEIINRIVPDLVVLDLAMPKVNGLEVLKQLRANPLFRTLPVIIFSDSAWKQQAWKEGATVVLSKSGSSPSQVVESARYALETSQPDQIDKKFARDVEHLAAASLSSGNANLNRRSKSQVLLVEDHDDIRTTISEALQQSGLQVTGVESHAAALHQLEAREFDAYLLNRVCPDGLGLALCRRIRQEYANKPIVLYSTVAIPISPEQRMNAGATAYLTEAGDLLNPGAVLLKLIDEARTTAHYLESNATDELSILTA